MTKCQGCGVLLQQDNVDDTKATHFCERCFKIKHYNEYIKTSISKNDLKQMLHEVNSSNDLTILVVDIFNIDSIKIFEKYISNPVILVVTKRDILSKDFKENKYLKNIKTKLNIKNKLFISNRNNYNFDLLFSLITKYQTSKNVYVLGVTNVGKSSLVNKMIYNYSNNKSDITVSNLPSTTQDTIKVSLNNNLLLIDTPGLDLNEFIHNASKELNKKIIAGKRINPIIIQAKIKQTIIIEDFVRLDVNPNTFIFYMSNQLTINRYYASTKILEHKQLITLSVKVNQEIVIDGIAIIKVKQNDNVNIYGEDGLNIYVRDTYL